MPMEMQNLLKEFLAAQKQVKKENQTPHKQVLPLVFFKGEVQAWTLTMAPQDLRHTQIFNIGRYAR